MKSSRATHWSFALVSLLVFTATMAGLAGDASNPDFALGANYRSPTFVGHLVRGGLTGCGQCTTSVEPRYVVDDPLGCFYDSNTISLVSLNDFEGDVTLEILGLPAGVTSQTATLLTVPRRSAVSTPFRLQAASGAAAGGATVTVRATSGTIVHTIDLPISVVDQLPVCDAGAEPVPPTVTSSPLTGALVGRTYTYQAVASGTQPITWTLASDAPGMTIDSNTGLASWSPGAGDFTVQITATNSGGSATQSYTLISRDQAQAIVLQVADGVDLKSGKSLVEQGLNGVVQESDNVRLRVDPGNRFVFRFDAFPANAGVVETLVFVEHHQEKPMPAGSIVWQVGKGNFFFPAPLQMTRPALLIGSAAEATASWDVTGNIPNAATVNDMKFVFDNNGNEKSLIDRVLVRILAVW